MVTLVENYAHSTVTKFYKKKNFLCLPWNICSSKLKGLCQFQGVSKSCSRNQLIKDIKSCLTIHNHIQDPIQDPIHDSIHASHPWVHPSSHPNFNPRHIPWFIQRSIHYSIKYPICYSIQDATHDSIQNPTHCPIQDPINDPSVMFWIFWPWSHNGSKKWLLIWTLIWPWFLGQLFLMDRFLDGTFFTFGIEVISFAMRDEEDRVDPVIYIFPRMTKCTFHKFGTSGNIESHDALCILPINIVNEKIYVFLWFWFLILGSMTLLVVLYRLIIIFSPRMRAYLLFIRFRLIKKECINIIIKKTQMGDWFLLYMLGQNVDSMIFKEVIHELARRLGYSSKDLIDF